MFPNDVGFLVDSELSVDEGSAFEEQMAYVKVVISIRFEELKLEQQLEMTLELR